MQRTMLISLLLIAALILGCAKTIECNSPMKIVRDRCCIDANNNEICDIDEGKYAVEKTNKSTIQENITKPTANVTPNKTTAPPVVQQTKQMNTEVEAIKTGKIFAEKWQAKQYAIMYSLFTPELKEKKTLTEFTTIMELEPLYRRLTKVDFKGVKMTDEDSAELMITIHTNIQDIDMPGATLEFIDNSWRVNMFNDVFELSAYDAACSGYRNNNDYTVYDCANDFAKKTKNASYCDKSRCHYVECLKALNQPASTKQQVKQCELCPPVGKTVNECVLDLAIKQDSLLACDYISEESYSDKYCICYGGFAKSKKTVGYCNIIQNPDYKELCITGYNGEYCYLH
jgi:hypothetical protein